MTSEEGRPLQTSRTEATEANPKKQQPCLEREAKDKSSQQSLVM